MKIQPSLMSEVKKLFNLEENSAVAPIFKIWPQGSAENTIIWKVLVVIFAILHIFDNNLANIHSHFQYPGIYIFLKLLSFSCKA